MKKLIILLFLFNTANGQPVSYGVFGAQADYSFVYNQPGVSGFGGYKFHNNYVGLSAGVYPESVRNIPVNIRMEYGYMIGSFQPFTGFGYFTSGEAIKAKEGPHGFEIVGGINYYPVQLPLKIQLLYSKRNIVLGIGSYLNF